MAAPDLDSFAERTYDEVEPMRALDAFNGYALAHYLAAIGTLFQEIEDYAADGPNGEVGWSGILDLDRSPDKGLDWLGQFVGVLPRGGLTSAEHRQRIVNHEQWDRGTPQAMIKAIKLHLTGQQRVVLYERDTSAYHLSIVTYTSETPVDTAPILLEIKQQKPAGIIVNYSVSTGQDYLNVFVSYANYQTVLTTFASYADLLNNRPSGGATTRSYATGTYSSGTYAST